MEGPMIIEAEMGGHCVHRMYVDGGSSSEILYEHCFSKFRPKIKNQLIHANTPLVGSSEEIIWPLGSPSPYNGIIRRPGVKKIRAIPSTTHGMLKFPVAGRIVTLRRSRIIPLECSIVSESGVPRPIINQVTEEKIQVAIHPKYPKQTIAIGSTLIEEGRKELYGLLRRHIDVFVSKPADMTGVPWHIAEHILNVREGCLLVRQKKKGQGTERNKAISEEVKKLVEADIIKEVHYHSWLSNPVMVKKHDDSWRMCMDFKDLNKTCLKDEEDEEKMAFITSQGIFCYLKMPFGLKNAGATYQQAEMAFKGMKQLIAELPMLTAPKEKEELIMYLAATKESINAVLMTKRDGKQVPIYFVSRALQGPEINYTPMEKLILALLSENTTQYRPKALIKGQIMADFIVERLEDDTPDTSMEDSLIITNPEGMEFTYALRFRFNATNNETEYETLIAGLRVARPMGVQNLQANVDSRLIANQVNGIYIAKESSMIKYLEKVKNLASTFKGFSIKQIPRGENKKADALSKITYTSFTHLSKQVLVKELREKSIDEKEILAVVEEERHIWMTPVYEYLMEGILLEEKRKQGMKRLCLNLQKSTKNRTISAQDQKPQRKAGSGSKFSSNNTTLKLNLSKFQSLRTSFAQRSKPNLSKVKYQSPGTNCVNFSKLQEGLKFPRG
uniref:Reverse transcriptase domain-containing protein n=1 Tax=Tanacetum cinerariifolium TaxID=118510 RepID=A0A699I6H0_TANCI|nr:reverse transcriptase domain-containing protein [Tanacetum cinerariifolium]